SGVSPLLAKEIVHQAKLGAQSAFTNSFETYKKALLNNDFVPTIYKGNRKDYHVYPITHLNVEKDIYSSTNEMLDNFYSGKDEKDSIKIQAKDLYRLIINNIKKNKKNIK